VHDNLVEGIVVADDDLLERYLEGDTPPSRSSSAPWPTGWTGPTCSPSCAARPAPIGVDRLADFICEIGPPRSIGPRHRRAAGDTVEVEPDARRRALAFVFKTSPTPTSASSRCSRCCRAPSGPDDHLVNTRTGADERLHALFALRGREHLDVRRARRRHRRGGKLADTRTGDTWPPRASRWCVPIEWPDPVLAVAIKARTQADDDKLANALHRLLDEDPSLRVERNDETHQTLLKGMGETHLLVTLEKLERKFGVEVDTEEVRIAYRETINATAAPRASTRSRAAGTASSGSLTSVSPEPSRRSRLRVRRQDRGRRHPPPVHPRRREGHRGAMAEGGVHGFPVVDVRRSRCSTASTTRSTPRR
jgi:elongation factor G